MKGSKKRKMVMIIQMIGIIEADQEIITKEDIPEMIIIREIKNEIIIDMIIMS